MLAVAASEIKDFTTMKGARGFIEWTDDASRQMGGWVLSADVEFTSVEVYLNGTWAGAAPIEPRPDVASAHPWIPHASQSGFRVRLETGEICTNGANRVHVLGCQGSKPVARLADVFRRGGDATFPTPPPELMRRVQGAPSPELFRESGFKFYTQFRDVIARHRDPLSMRRLLDWGCGCGRLAIYFLSDPARPQVFGCDIDTDAVAWCQANLPQGDFAPIIREPAMPYPDTAFDVAIAMGVFMSLDRQLQDAWLPELRRVMAPGGLFVASVQGELAAPFLHPPTTVAQLLRDGIIGPWDRDPGVFQTRAYTLREWSKYFEVLEYIEAGLNAHHDLVVMRRPAGS